MLSKAETARLIRIEHELKKLPRLPEDSMSHQYYNSHSVYDAWGLMSWAISQNEVGYLVDWLDRHPERWEA